jgi:hypothetical protein
VLLEPEREAELRELIARLDRLVPRDGAHLTISSDSQSGTTIGNRLGYLRFGVEMLSAALDPLPGSDETPATIAPQLDGLLTEDSDSVFEVCEIDESIASRPPIVARLGPLGHVVAGVVIVALAILLFVGAALAWRFLFG